ncbi:MAG: hypothetical protein HY796_05895 [Elusimicrobia bacterium]|nr:hypothetical protein [Elusimicrobiota bacterium]
MLKFGRVQNVKGKIVIAVLAAVFSNCNIPNILANNNREASFDQNAYASFLNALNDIKKDGCEYFIVLDGLLDMPQVNAVPTSKQFIPGGPLVPGIVNNPNYLKGLALKPAIEKLPENLGGPLLKQWAGLEKTKEALLIDATKLDGLDEQYFAEAKILNQQAALLNKERDEYLKAVEKYNKDCVNNPYPDIPSCNTEFNRLKEWHDDLLDRITKHNKKVAELQGKIDTLVRDAEKLKKEVQKWDANLGSFIQVAEKTLADAGMTRVRVQAQNGSLVWASQPLNVLGYITLNQGLRLLDTLWAGLTPAQQANLDRALACAQRYMMNAAAGGGVGPSEQACYNTPGQGGPRMILLSLLAERLSTLRQNE